MNSDTIFLSFRSNVGKLKFISKKQNLTSVDIGDVDGKKYAGRRLKRLNVGLRLNP
jgi:hypothetical protein